jgi:hypothetical protein
VKANRICPSCSAILAKDDLYRDDVVYDAHRSDGDRTILITRTKRWWWTDSLEEWVRMPDGEWIDAENCIPPTDSFRDQLDNFYRLKVTTNPEQPGGSDGE